MSTSAFLDKRPLIPDTITYALAHSPLVQLVSGPPGHERSARLAVAPYDDLLILFASAGSATLENLERENASEVHAREPNGAWQLKMKGRAVCAGSVNAHPRRLELQPWLPDGSKGHRLFAVEFVPAWIEYTEGEGDARKVFYGPTAAANIPPVHHRWLLSAFGGIVTPGVLGFTVLWGWMAWYGQHLPFRWLVATVCFLALVGLMAGARLLYRVEAFRRWQRGVGLRADAGQLGKGWMAMNHARRVGQVGMGTALFLLLLVYATWGVQPVQVVLVTCQLWWLLPAWVAHLRRDRVERDNTEKGDLLED